MGSQPIFKVMKSGLSTTFQDLGRYGYQKFGVPTSGAMDRYAYTMANILVGNQRNEACLEVALIGPRLKALHEVTLAITGADLQPVVNGQKQKMWTTFTMQKGDELSFAQHRQGVFSYIAVAGGFDCPEYLGSRSTDMSSEFGNLIQIGDILRGHPRLHSKGIGLQNKLIPIYETNVEVAVIEGPHTDHFTKKEREQFFKNVYTLQSNSNRMGYRLKSQHMNWTDKDNIWSDAIPFGGIQIIPSGEPIVLMADRQTTGGYPRIGTVASVDIPKVAQLTPGGEIKFYPVSIEQAQVRLKEQARLFELIEAEVATIK
ncbi:biotin-dependent carboxyltransferase family protein [Bacillaceae bacterium W0354]